MTPRPILTRTVRPLLIASTLVALPLLGLIGTTVQAVVIDDFQDGTTAGWRNGGATPDPVNLPDGGPNGAGDHALRATADGQGDGGRLVIFNTSNPVWTGDLSAHGTISGVMRADVGDGTPLTMRAAIDGPGGRFATTSSVTIPRDNQYHPFVLDILASDFTPDGGTNLNATLTAVSTLRLLHNPTPAWRGVNIVATLDIDSGPIIPEPSTALLAGLSTITVCGSRPRRRK